MTAPDYSVVQYPHRNPGASTPLTLTLVVVPNTSPEDVVRNIKANSALPHEWLKMKPKNHLPAVLVGGGPSVADHVDEIARLRSSGAILYATNAASQWLQRHGIVPDYQVIADPKEETATLVDPAAAQHLFSSAVNPATMAVVANPIVWHRAIEGIEACFPEDRKQEEYCVIGGTSAGTHAMCIAYALGHRSLHCFGFDSSHRDGNGHAYSQPMNDSIDVCEVRWAGKVYHASIAMKAQAENFMILSRALQKLGVTINVHGDGLLPAMWNTPPEVLSEQDKYRLMWSFDSYRTNSPSEDLLPYILKLLQPDGQVIDFGCGTGRAALEMSKRGLDVFLVDFADNCRDQEAIFLPFLQWDLCEPLPIHAPYGVCCDVLEHIAPDNVPKVLQNIGMAADKVFISVGTEDDTMGNLIGQQLHLTIRHHDWWLQQINAIGTVQYHRNLGDQSQFLVTTNGKTAVH